jgi:ankyrin repeat protein
MGKIDFFKARAERNYQGQTIEHVVCEMSHYDLIESISPRPDTPDYEGNYPIFCSVLKNDSKMIDTYFNKGKVYFPLRNYRYETLFHIAARGNSLEAIERLTSNCFFFEEMIRKNFKGDTPLHVAAKHGKLEILEYFLKRCTSNFLKM